MFLDTLTTLMKARKINKRQLSIESGVPYTTIISFYKVGCDNVKLSTLERLAEYFGVTLDYLVRGSDTGLSHHDCALLDAYHRHPDMQPAVDRLLGIVDDSPTLSSDLSETVSALMSKSTVSK